MKLRCSKCSAKLERMARVDSDDRIESKWHYCPDCGWGQRRVDRNAETTEQPS